MRSFSLNKISISLTVPLDILQLECLFFRPSSSTNLQTPVRFRHATLFSYWKNPNTLFRIQEKTLTSLFFFRKIQEWNNQPIDIGRPNGFFLCIICGSNEIHRYRKKPYQIKIFSFNHISIVNTYIRTATTKSIAPLIMKYQLLVEPSKLRDSRILQIWWSRSFRKCSRREKMWMKDPTKLNWSMNLRNTENFLSLSISLPICNARYAICYMQYALWDMLNVIRDM